MSNKPTVMPTPDIQTPEEFHASRVAEVYAFLSAKPTERGKVTLSSMKKWRDDLGGYEIPAEVGRAMPRMLNALRAFEDSGYSFTSMSEEGFRVQVDPAIGRQHLGDNLEDATLFGHRTDGGAYELSVRLTERYRNPDGTLAESMGNWGTTTVRLEPGSIRVQTREDKTCTWERKYQ